MANQPYIKIESGPDVGTEIRIPKSSFVFGRDASSDYAISNEKVSRRHARVFLLDGRWMLEDLLSKNHTLLNGVKIEAGKPQLLTDEDRIQLATQVVLKFHDPSSTMSDELRVVTDGLWMDCSNGDVYIHNRRLDPKLPRGGFNILVLLYEKSHAKSPIASKEEIEAAGWPGEYGVNDQMIDSEIYRLKKRLAELEPSHEFIKTERGRGKFFVQLK